MALDVQGGSTTAGAPLIQWPSNNANNQQWSLVATGDGYYKLVNRNSGQLADDANNSQKAGTNIIQWPSNGAPNQEWSLIQA
jgi:hypothetical protein